MQKLLLATTNQAKLAEIRTFLSDSQFELITLSDCGITEQAPEQGVTFEENALSKARFYSKKSNMPALADDGGLEIDALNGEPGVSSHRWVSKTHEDDDETLITHVFERMKDIPEGKRGAQMRLVLALVTSDGKEFTTEGVIRGVITKEPSSHRTPGFPYRSVLFLPEIGKYYNKEELTEEETEHYNHRKYAVEKMKPIIRKIC